MKIFLEGDEVKRSIKRFLLLFIFLMIISIIVMIFMGNIYTTSFMINDSNYEFSISNNDVIEVIDKQDRDGLYVVTVKAKRPGVVDLNMNYGDYSSIKKLYIHKTMVITSDNFFGYSRGSEIIPISLSILLGYLLFLFITRYRRSVRENIFQYKNVAYLGIIIYISFFTLSNVVSIFHYEGLFGTVNKTITSMNLVSLFLFPIAFITFVLVTISNINLIRKEGKSFKNLLGLFLGVFVCVLTFLPDYIYGILMQTQIVDIYNLNSVGPYLYNFFESVIYLVVAYLECILIGTIVVALKSVKSKINYNKDYIIILGCMIKKDGTLTPLLQGRVDRAIEFRNEQVRSTGKDLVFIPSGGKGSDEIISEAEAMRNYLVDKGIKEKNILLENKSKNTYENIKFSYQLIKNKKANVMFSTTNYHVFRAGLIATEQGLVLEGIGSSTKSYFWINAFIREFIGTLYSERKKHIVVFIIILIVLMVMISITYFANNI